MPLAIPKTNAWLYQTLAGDATLSALVSGRIYARRIPEGKPLPALVYQWQGGSTALLVGGGQLWSDMVYVVKAVGDDAAAASLPAIVDRVDLLLHRARGFPTGGGEVFECVQESELQYEEAAEGGPFFQHLGAKYRIRAKGS